MVTVPDIKEMVDGILTDDDMDTIVEIPLKTLIWTIVSYSYKMKDIEDELCNKPLSEKDYNNRVFDKEYTAARRDELARIITMFSDFDTRRIWSETDKIFPERVLF